MAEYSGWRNFWWLNVAMIGATFLAVAIGFPETKWDRTRPDDLLTTTTASVPSSEKMKSEQKTEFSELVEVNTPGEGLQGLSHAQTSERDPWLHKGSPSKQQFKLFQTIKVSRHTQYYDARFFNHVQDDWNVDNHPSIPGTILRQCVLTIISLDPLKSILLDLWIPIKLFAFPIVEFASFVVSWSASCCKRCF